MPTKPGVERIEDKWHAARLIPTTGIGGQKDQEERATSSLLAVMKAVPEFGQAVLNHLDAPAGRITTYSEVRFSAEGKGRRSPMAASSWSGAKLAGVVLWR